MFARELQKEILLNRETTPPQKNIFLENLAKKRSLERRSQSLNNTASSGAGGSLNITTPTSVKDPPKILERTLKCCLLNGLVFWLSIVLFEDVFLPLIRTFLRVLLGEGDVNESLWAFVSPALNFTFSTLWVLPFFLLSKIVNAIWFQDIADSAFKSSKGRPQMMSSLSIMIADTVFTILLEAIFLVQGKILGYCPIKILGVLVNLSHLCILHSLYCFEYKWFNQGLELHKRLTFIETNWPYFLGFGFPLAVITSLPENYVVAGCVFSILFPLFIVSGNQAQVVTGACSVPFKFFTPTLMISNKIFSKIFIVKN